MTRLLAGYYTCTSCCATVLRGNILATCGQPVKSTVKDTDRCHSAANGYGGFIVSRHFLSPENDFQVSWQSCYLYIFNSVLTIVRIRQAKYEKFGFFFFVQGVSIYHASVRVYGYQLAYPLYVDTGVF